MSRLLKNTIVICAALLIAITLCARPVSTRVLFIGNSYTCFNEGIGGVLDGLAPGNESTQIAPGGYSLEMHWNDGTARKAMRPGKFKYVLLQEQSQNPIFSPAKFREFCAKFDAEIKKNGAETVLLMTWERPDSIAAGAGATTANLEKAFNAIGRELGIKVAPVGLAFERSLKNRPDIKLITGPDGHPTAYGTYLAACVIYATIFKKSPAGNPYSGGNISADIRAHLQLTTAKTLGY